MCEFCLGNVSKHHTCVQNTSGETKPFSGNPEYHPGVTPGGIPWGYPLGGPGGYQSCFFLGRKNTPFAKKFDIQNVFFFEFLYRTYLCSCCPLLTPLIFRSCPVGHASPGHVLPLFHSVMFLHRPCFNQGITIAKCGCFLKYFFEFMCCCSSS